MEVSIFFVVSNQSRGGQGTKKNYRAGQDTGYRNSSRAGYRLQKYLNLQSSTDEEGSPT